MIINKVDLDELCRLATCGDYDFLKRIMNNVKLDKSDLDLIFISAITRGHIEICEFLIKEGADPNSWYDSVVRWNHYGKVIKLLKDNGIDVNNYK